MGIHVPTQKFKISVNRLEHYHFEVRMWKLKKKLNIRTVIELNHFVFKIHVCCLLAPGDVEQELGPPPSVDEAANTLMTRLGFLLGEKVTEVQPGDQYSMEVQDENQVSYAVSTWWYNENQHFTARKEKWYGAWVCAHSERNKISCLEFILRPRI